MNKVRVTKEFDFETAHALDGYEGKCKDIHGHSYHLEISVLGTTEQNPSKSDCGMVIDFGDLKAILKNHIKPLFDHRLILREDSRFKGLEKSNERIRYVSYQPTCENMMMEMQTILQKHLSTHVQLVRVFLRETANSYSEWLLSDQQL